VLEEGNAVIYKRYYGDLVSSDIEEFLADYTPDVRELAWKMRAVIREVMPETIEQLDAPAHLIGYGIDRTYKGLICGITMHTAHINLMFARGTELPDPEHLLVGSGKRARHVKIQRSAEVENPAVRALLVAAIRQRQGASL
jgi:hypothetical protein